MRKLSSKTILGMSNLNTYLEERGSFRINQKHPFNDIDAMVLARISYLPLDKIALRNRETIKSVCLKLNKLKPKDFCWPDDVILMKNLLNSERFCRMRLVKYVKNNSRASERQFSAVTIQMNFSTMYLSFFGTDDSVTGWKEDFNLAIMDVIPAQEEGAEYLKKLHRHYFWKKIYMGGHSKGGNVAMYAALTAPDSYQRKMIKIYNFDGPGLRKGTAALDVGTEKVLKKIHSFIPQDSIIGRLFEHTEGFTVVESVSKSFYQHDIYSWQVSGTKLVKSESTRASDLVDKTITNWLESASMEEKKIFIDGMFKIFDEADVKGPLDLKARWLKYAPILAKAYMNMPKENRKVIVKVWKKLGVAFLKARKGKDV